MHRALQFAVHGSFFIMNAKTDVETEEPLTGLSWPQFHPNLNPLIH